jgi:hypothetical protein
MEKSFIGFMMDFSRLHHHEKALHKLYEGLFFNFTRAYELSRQR